MGFWLGSQSSVPAFVVPQEVVGVWCPWGHVQLQEEWGGFTEVKAGTVQSQPPEGHREEPAGGWEDSAFVLGFSPAHTRPCRALLDSMSAHTGRLSTDGRSLDREPVWEEEGRKEGGLVTCAFSGAPAPSSQASRAGDPCHLLYPLTLAPGLLRGWKPFVWSPRKQCSLKRQSAVGGEAHTPDCGTVPFVRKTLLWKNVRTKQCLF